MSTRGEWAVRVKWDEWDAPRIWTLDDRGKPYTRETAFKEQPNWDRDAHATVIERVVTTTEWVESAPASPGASLGDDQ